MTGYPSYVLLILAKNRIENYHDMKDGNNFIDHKI